MRNVTVAVLALMLAFATPAMVRAEDQPNSVQKFVIKADLYDAHEHVLDTLTYTAKNFDDKASCEDFGHNDADLAANAKALLAQVSADNPEVAGIGLRCEAQDGE